MFKENIRHTLFANSTIFLNCAVSFLNKGLNNDGNKLLTIVNLQMALELAIKVKLVDYYGLTCILKNVSRDISDNDLAEMYKQNKLKVNEFEQLKNFLKRENVVDFDKSEYSYMERFQLYRNKLVHFCYEFSTAENLQMEKDIIHVLVYILGILLSDEAGLENRTYMQDYIDMDEYKKLIENPQYYTALSDLIDFEYGDPYYCPMCSKKLLTADKKCLGCLLSFDNDTYFGYVECQNCHEDMVIYDKLNMKHNPTGMNGLCLYCFKHTTVYQCPTCGRVFNQDDCNYRCKPGYCEEE